MNEKQILFFSAPWCEGCQQLKPVIDQLKRNITVEEINIDYDSDRASDAKVQSIPTTILVQNGQEIKRFVGPKSYNAIINWINS